MTAPGTEAPLFARSGGDQTRILIVLTLLVSLAAKFMGFVRVQQIATLLGVTVYADALLLTFQLVWFLETVLVSGAVIPNLIARVYRVEAEQGTDQAARFFLHATIWCSLGTLLYGLVLWLFADQIVVAAAPGFNSAARELFGELLAISVLTPLCLTLSEYASMVNRLTRNGAWYSVPQLVTNLTALVGLVLGYRLTGAAGAAKGMIVGLSVGACAVVLLQLSVVPRAAGARLFKYLRESLFRPLVWPGGRSFWSGVAALVLAALVSELYVYVDFYFASTVRPGGIGLISYASRLANLANMLLVSSAFVILEPRWAEALAEGGRAPWRRIIGPDSVGLLSILAAPVAVLLCFAPQVTGLIYQAGQMQPADAVTLNELTRIYGLSILTISAAMIMARILVLYGKARWIVLTSLAVLPIKVALSAAFAPWFGLNGLAWATIGGLTLQVLAYAAILSRSGIPFSLPDVTKPAVRLALVYLATGGTAVALSMPRFEQSVLIVAAWGAVLAVNIAVGAALGFAYSDAVKSLLSPASWRSGLSKLLGRT
jgi:putative peptidoglycan lipid II flippase